MSSPGPREQLCSVPHLVGAIMTSLCFNVASILPIFAPSILIGLGAVDLCDVSNCFEKWESPPPLFKALDK